MRVCERMHITEDQFEEFDVERKAKYIAYEQLREHEENEDLAIMANAKLT